MDINTTTSAVYNTGFGRPNAASFQTSQSNMDSSQKTNSSQSVDAMGKQTNSAIQREKDESVKKDQQELDKLKEELNKELNSLNVDAKFGYDDKTGAMYVSIYEKDTDKLLRKVPSDEVLKMMSKMKELMGSIIDKQA